MKAHWRGFMGILNLKVAFLSNPTGFPNMFANQIILRILKSCLKFSKISLFITKIKKGKGNKAGCRQNNCKMVINH